MSKVSPSSKTSISLKTSASSQTTASSSTAVSATTGEPVDQESDQQLIIACLEGNEQAWERLIQRYSRLIYTIPLRFGFGKPIADEIFQETCLILLEKLDTLRDHNRLHSWLMTVSRRACIQRLRQKEEIALVDNEQLDGRFPDLEKTLIELEQHLLIQQAFASLPARCQTLLTALFFTDPPPAYEEIAKHLDTVPGSIGPTRLRCLKKLRQALAKL